VPAEALIETPRRKKGDAPLVTPFVKYLPIEDDYSGQPPMRRVVLVWRRSFTRYEAIATLRNAVYACELPGVTRLS
jgi:LysR family hydrogen peroxide-inducible transcriptional activator